MFAIAKLFFVLNATAERYEHSVVLARIAIPDHRVAKSVNVPSVVPSTGISPRFELPAQLDSCVVVLAVCIFCQSEFGVVVVFVIQQAKDFFQALLVTNKEELAI